VTLPKAWILSRRTRWSVVAGGTCSRLLTQEALEGLVKALDLAAGLRMVRRGVFEDDAEAVGCTYSVVFRRRHMAR
jgi:hypothetical protein